MSTAWTAGEPPKDGQLYWVLLEGQPPRCAVAHWVNEHEACVDLSRIDFCEKIMEWEDEGEDTYSCGYLKPAFVERVTISHPDMPEMLMPITGQIIAFYPLPNEVNAKGPGCEPGFVQGGAVTAGDDIYRMG